MHSWTTPVNLGWQQLQWTYGTYISRFVLSAPAEGGGTWQGFDEKSGKPLRAVEMAKWPHHRLLLEQGFNVLHSRRWSSFLHFKTRFIRLLAVTLCIQK